MCGKEQSPGVMGPWAFKIRNRSRERRTGRNQMDSASEENYEQEETEETEMVSTAVPRFKFNGPVRWLATAWGGRVSQTQELSLKESREGAVRPWKWAWTDSQRNSKTDQRRCVQVAIVDQIRSNQRCPDSLRDPWVI